MKKENRGVKRGIAKRIENIARKEGHDTIKVYVDFVSSVACALPLGAREKEYMDIVEIH